VPREGSYTLLALLGLLPLVRTVGSRQLALLRLKGIGTGTLVQRFRAYPRIVAPLFGQLLQRQWIHARSLAARGFYLRPPVTTPRHALISRRDWVTVAYLAGIAGLGWAVFLGAR
jgi:energy-coupling factor transporter transmembrane protein EcfT